MPVSLASAPATTHGAVVPIAYATPSSATVTFSNIPQTYQDLLIVLYARDTNASTVGGIYGAFNGTYGGAANYSLTRLFGDGASATSNRVSNQTFIAADGYYPGASSTSGIFGSGEIHILNYANTSTNKTYIHRMAADQNGSGYSYLSVGLWRQTAAISSIYLQLVSNFAAGTTIALYGIRSVNQ